MLFGPILTLLGRFFVSEREATPQEDATEEGLLDGREPGDAKSRYSLLENIQIYTEAALLVGIIVSGLYLFATQLADTSDALKQSALATPPTEPAIDRAALLHVKSLFLSGLLGGCVFSLKWLYHSIANGIWNRDRFLWRFGVPLIGGVLGVFVTFVTSRTVGVMFDAASLDSIDFYVRCGFAFLIGIFADGVVAFLERLARRIFGTLNVGDVD